MKKRKGSKEPTQVAPAAGDVRRLGRLEGRLEKLRALETKRTRQLAKAQRKGTSVEAKLAALRAVSTPGPVAIDPIGHSQAYCLREKRTVEMVEAQRVVLRNGRTALAGTCPTCGASLFRMVGTASSATQDHSPVADA